MATILAFDTSATACIITLIHETSIITEELFVPMQHARQILPLIDQCLRKAELKLHHLDAIAYGAGPGSFTGIRIANSVAQGLALAANLPIIQLSNLALLAQTALEKVAFDRCLVGIDAKMNEVYWAVYQSSEDQNVQLINTESINQPKDINLSQYDSLSGTSLPAIGEIWQSYQDVLKQQIHPSISAINPISYPSATALTQLAQYAWLNCKHISALEAMPHYLRSVNTIYKSHND